MAGSTVPQLQQVGDRDRQRGRGHVNPLLGCTCSDFSGPIGVGVSCGELKLSIERAGRNTGCG